MRVFTLFGFFCVYFFVFVQARGAPPKVPILYSTDLYHPHGDPDDHYDLATLFAIDQFDIRGIVIDIRGDNVHDVGRAPLEQMMRITGRRVPYAVGLTRDLNDPTDKVLDVPSRFQGGVELILSSLREAEQKVVLFLAGSCRDAAVALNRDPDLLKEKIKALYINAGNYPSGLQWEHNVRMAPVSYFRLFRSGLPIYWCPCWASESAETREKSRRRPNLATYYQADQTEVVAACTSPVQNYFVYCLTRSSADPIAFLQSGPHPLPEGIRHMWCTAPLIHAAGWKTYRSDSDQFVALSPDDPQVSRAGMKEVDVFDFVSMHATVRQPRATAEAKPPTVESGQLVAVYQGKTKDRVGTRSAEPDHRDDCCVRLFGLPERNPIENIVITGPQDGRWELRETGRWWRIAHERQDSSMDCYFQFYAAGQHWIEIILVDGTSKSAKFHVPEPDAMRLEVELEPAEPNGFVFRATSQEYERVLESCLKHLLARLGRSGANR